MKKLLMTAAAFLFAVTLFAQRGNMDPGTRATRQTERMKEILALNENQYASVKSINEKYASKSAELRKDSSANNRAAMHALQQERKKEIGAVLTPEQKQKWTEHNAEMRSKMKQSRDDRRNSREQMEQSLGLSGDQKAKLDEARKSFREKAASIHKSTASETDKRAQVKQARLDHEESVKKILNTDQFAKWKAMQKERKGKMGGKKAHPKK